METVEILRRARAELQRRGWTRYTLWDRNKPVDSAPCCAMGAIWAAVTGRPDATQASDNQHNRALAAAFALKAVTPRCSVADWSDSRQSIGDVLGGFDLAIAASDSKCPFGLKDGK